MRRTNMVIPILICAATLALTSCSVSLPQGANGSIILMPFWDEQQGIQGVQPLEGWSEEAMIQQLAIPGSTQDALAELLVQTGLTSVPELTGNYEGKALRWDLYEFETHVDSVPVDLVRFDLALAEDEPTTYVVMLLVLPDAYAANPALYDAVFTHALYALEPME